MRFDTVDAQARPVCTTWYGTIYRGVEVAGPDRRADDAPAPPMAPRAGDTARAESRSRSRRARRTSTPNARASGIRSIPTRRSPPPPDCPRLCCTAPPPSHSRSRR